MQLEKKLFCSWGWLRLVSEDYIKQKDRTYLTISLTESEDPNSELMIFLGKDRFNPYEVRVYKNKPTDKYMPKEQDDVKKYEENDEYATFYFNKYEQAREFVYMLAFVHPEYKVRPSRKIEEGEDA